MMDFLFFMKTFFLTVIVVLIMQIQVGERSLETHAMGWVQTSAIVGPLNRVAQGGARVIRDVTHSLASSIQGGKNPEAEKKQKEERRSPFRWTFKLNQEQDPKNKN